MAEPDTAAVLCETCSHSAGLLLLKVIDATELAFKPRRVCRRLHFLGICDMADALEAMYAPAVDKEHEFENGVRWILRASWTLDALDGNSQEGDHDSL